MARPSHSRKTANMFKVGVRSFEELEACKAMLSKHRTGREAPGVAFQQRTGNSVDALHANGL